VCHAELNAIVNKNSSDIKGCMLYTTLFPCNECAKLILQSGIKEIIYLSDDKANKDEFRSSKKMLEFANVKLRYQLSRVIDVLFVRNVLFSFLFV
jgi:dCMP deaminase